MPQLTDLPPNNADVTTQTAGQDQIDQQDSPIEFPDFVTASPRSFLDEEPSGMPQISQNAPPPPQQQPPPQYSQQQQEFRVPEYDDEALLSNPRQVIDNHIKAYMSMIVPAIMRIHERVTEMNSRGPQLHPEYVNRSFRDVQSAIKDVYENVYHKDEAFRNPAVRGRVDGYLKQEVRRAYRRALEGDFDGVEALSNKNFLMTVLDHAKRLSGVTSGSPSVPRGAQMTQPRAAQPHRTVQISDEQREVLAQLGISEEEYVKLSLEKQNV